MRYSIEPRDRIFEENFWIFSFAGNIWKKIRENVSGKYSQKRLDHAKQCATHVLNTSKKTNSKTALTKSDLPGNEIIDKIKIILA